MNRMSPFLLGALLGAALLGYVLGAHGGSLPQAQAATRYEYKAFNIMEFQIQGDKIPGEAWVQPSHQDQPLKKIGDALLQDRVIMSKTLNGISNEGWEPVMIYLNTIVARRAIQ
jgi:hypothetical protein